jgi:hypothetical protein
LHRLLLVAFELGRLSLINVALVVRYHTRGKQILVRECVEDSFLVWKSFSSIRMRTMA